MSLSIVPAICLLIVVMLSQTDKTTSSFERRKQYEKQRVNYIAIQKKSRKSQKDYDTIYSYIVKKFKGVDQKDAEEISKNLVDYGEKYDVDPKFAAAVIARESAFKKNAVSQTGAKGLGQIKDFNYKDLKIDDPFNIGENVSGTVQYLKKMMKKWKDEDKKEKRTPGSKRSEESKVKLALASYYKGFTNVKTTGVDKKTEAYVNDIIAYYEEIMDSKK